MCQLLGLSFNQEIHPGKYFSKFLSRSRLHPDGWGLALHPSGCNTSILFKEPMTGLESGYAKFLCNYKRINTKTCIGHIRKATRGNLTYDNTHPFTRCYYGVEYSFAHNGTLFRRDRLTNLTYQPIGETDSEHAFCYLLSRLRDNGIKPCKGLKREVYSEQDFEIIHRILTDINTLADGTYNCIFCDGKYLFCYRDLAEARNLFYQKVNGKLKNTGIGKKDLKQISYMEKNENIEGFVVTTEPLNDEIWHSFMGGHLIVFRDGKKVADIS